MRKSGILLPIFSLPSPYGIGTLGRESYRFVDFLKDAGQSYWQILPLHPTGYGDSPYQSFSSFAGNPYFIDLDLLREEGLLTAAELQSADFGQDARRVDYGKQYENRYPLLRLAFMRFSRTAGDAFDAFCAKEQSWLDDYALFMALKNAACGAAWNRWSSALRRREPSAMAEARETHRQEIRFWQFLQFQFFRQWHDLQAYAHRQGIEIIGDIPMYVAYDSADVWAEPQQFLLDASGQPTVVAGCPPDGFSADGQLWGNPIYDWQYQKTAAPPYGWWERRLSHAMRLYDVVRIDHFRGFEAFYAIPFGAENAKEGQWMQGPGAALFQNLQAALGDLPIIAEDLGFLTPEVKALLAAVGYPGMKVLQFAFDTREESDYLPHNYEKHCVVYTGTHDNDTVLGWAQHAAPAEVEHAKRYLHMASEDSLNWCMMRAASASVADTVILMMQDLLGLGSEGRINTPSTLGGNWTWRVESGCVNRWLAGILRDMTALYGRLPDTEEQQPSKTK